VVIKPLIPSLWMIHTMLTLLTCPYRYMRKNIHFDAGFIFYEKSEIGPDLFAATAAF
jgi:hypothetical protein